MVAVFTKVNDFEQTHIIPGTVGATRRPRTKMALSFGTVLASMAAIWVTFRDVLQGCFDSSNKGQLAFNSQGIFKILQLTDVHLGEDPFTDWAPAADRKSMTLIRRVLSAEQPDLVVLSGDQLTGNNVNGNATEYYDQLCRALEEFTDIPYAMIFGNHDDMEFEPPDWMQSPVFAPTTLRRELMDFLQRRGSRNSLSRPGPSHVAGVSNYVLNVYHRGAVKLQIMLLDSGGGSMEQEVVSNQMEWFVQQRLPAADAVAFQHIPTLQYQYNESKCGGFDGEHGIAPLRNDAADEISFLRQHDPRLHFLAVGHNHGNSYCCNASENNTALLHRCFGRHSGYGGYGSWDRGARVYEISISPSRHDGAVSWRSWVHLDSGNVTDFYEPKPSFDARDVQMRRERLPPELRGLP